MSRVMLLFAVLRKGLQFSRENCLKTPGTMLHFLVEDLCNSISTFIQVIHGENDGSWLRIERGKANNNTLLNIII